MFKCICNTGGHDLKSDLCYFSRMAKSGGNHSKAPKGPINTHISIQSQRSNCSLAPPLSPGLPVGPSAISFSCVSTGFRGAVVSYVHNLLTIAHKRKLCSGGHNAHRSSHKAHYPPSCLPLPSTTALWWCARSVHYVHRTMHCAMQCTMHRAVHQLPAAHYGHGCGVKKASKVN